MIPEKILDYNITRLIGEGGMANVYEADLDKSLGTKVAIKVLKKHLATDESIRARFKQEANSMLALKHPYIVNVLNFVDTGDTLAIVMEYIEGQTLKQMVEKQGAINSKLATDIFTKILEAMQYVHEKGVIHRDIKPSNIFIIEGKYPKILDFGIVKLLGGESSIKTKTGLTIGTPMYMSPEQIQTPRDIDYRTDIYSLGVTLHYMLAGNPPYDSTESEFSIQSKVVRETLPKLFGVPSHITNAIEIATKKNRNHRFHSCKSFIDKLNSNNSDENTIIDKNSIIDENTKIDDLPIESNKPIPVESNEKQLTKINDFLAIYSNYFPVTHINMMRENLINLEKEKIDRIRFFPYKEPSKFMIISWVGGVIGLDRFQLGENTLGVVKLLFCWLTMGIWCVIDVFTSMGRVREWNYKKFMEIVNS